MIRTYDDLCKIPTFEKRFEYLKLEGTVANQTFGSSRYLHQLFYRSSEWLRIRRVVILRDNGCDLGIDDYQISGKIFIHHMNPITVDDIQSNISAVLDETGLICVSENTHLAIHYGDKTLLPQVPVMRFPGDTRLWRR